MRMGLPVISGHSIGPFDSAVDGRPEPRRAQRVTLSCAAVLLVAFVAVAADVRARSGGVFGDGLDPHVVSHPGTVMWRLASVASDVGSGPAVGVLAVVIGLILAWRHRWIDGAIVVVATASAGVAELAMKSVVGRSRPVTAAIAGESGQGFPSGHVCGLAALATALILTLAWGGTPRRTRLAAVLIGLLLVAAMAYSRLVLGAHYLSDTIGGLLLGTAIALLTVLVVPWLASTVEARRTLHRS